MVAPAAAEPSRSPTLAVRVAGAFGAMEELTWAAPEVDLIGSVELGRGYLQAAIGYAPIDSHTFLSDGQLVRAGLGFGTRFGGARAALALDVEHVAYHADPDVLAAHPGVDLLARRGGFLPTIGFEASRPVLGAVALGVFARVGLRELALFETDDGDRLDARLLLAGVFLELPLR